jgi:hypothetical protein
VSPGASAGTLTSIGSSFTNFGVIQFDAGGAWLIAGSTAGLAGGQIINGFAPGDTIGLTGVTDTIAGFAANKLTLDGSALLTLNLPGTFDVTQFHAAAVAGNTYLTETAALKQVLPGTYNASVTLNSAGYTNPITVTGTIDINSLGTAAVALDGSAPVAWTIDNQGVVEISGSRATAVRLAAGGAVTNATGATVLATGDGIDVLAAGGNLTNAGAIFGASGAGVSLAAGGSVTNNAGGTIGGGYGIAVSTSAASVTNAAGALIQGTSVDAVLIRAADGTLVNSGTIAGHTGAVYFVGGAVNNLAGTIISTTANAVSFAATGYVSNAIGAIIAGAHDGVVSGTVDARVQNAGLVAGTTDIGVLLTTGGTVGNASTGTIAGFKYGVDIQGPTRSLVNAGLITASHGTALRLHVSGSGAGIVGNSGSIIGSGNGIDVADNAAVVSNSGTIAGAFGYGVRLALAGSVTNSVRGTITGAGKDAIRINAAGQVFNYGSIGASGSGASGIYFNGSGNLYNVAGATLSGVLHGVAVSGGLATITNAGRIVSTNSTTGAAALDSGGALTNQAGGYIAGGYGVYVLGGGTVTNAGTIASTSTQDTAIDFAGGSPNQLIVAPGAVFLGVVNGGNTAGAGAVSVLTVEGTNGSLGGVGSSFANFGSIAFYPGAAWTISGSSAALAGGQPISGFARGDTIGLDGVATTGSAFQNGTLTLANGLTLDLPGANYSFSQFQITNDGTSTDISIACFRAGARILTDRGEVPVEALRPGMRVVSLTHRRLVPVTWIGARRIDCSRHPRPAEVWPVRIAANAFAPGAPHRPLFLSPDHAVFAGGRLVPVRFLLDGGAIAQVPVDAAEYYHVELAGHAVLVADGLPAETYLDTGNRAAFHNASADARQISRHRAAALA